MPLNLIYILPFFHSNRVFVIAEMANSHEGSISTAKKIIECAGKAKADAIKFQKFTADELAEPTHKAYSLYKKLEMSNRKWKELIKFAKKKKLKVFFDVFGVKSAKSLASEDVDGYKIHAADMDNFDLLRYFSKIKKPILVSTAGSKLNEIDEALKILLKVKKEIVLMYGFQGYPTKLSEMNLLRITNLKNRYRLPVGIMDHVSGDSAIATIIPLLGVSIGTTVVEKHITLDRSKKKLDYFSALNPNEFQNMVNLIHETKKSFGMSDFKISKDEMKYRLSHKKYPIAKRFIKKGTKLQENLFDFKRITPNPKAVSLYDFKGKKSLKNISKGAVLVENMISKESHKVAAIIACRVNSSRLFGKPLQQIGENSILERVLIHIRQSKMIDDVVLAISEKPGNEIFVTFAKENKLKFVIGNDKDVLKRLIDGAKYVGANNIFRTTPDCPFTYWQDIDPLIKKHLSGNYDLSWIPNAPLGTNYEIISLKALEISHKLGSARHRSELCSLYINEHQNKFRICKLQLPKKLQRPELRLTVDTPQDLMVMRMIYNSIGRDRKLIPLDRIIKFLDDNPSVAKINSNIPLGMGKIWFP